MAEDRESKGDREEEPEQESTQGEEEMLAKFDRALEDGGDPFDVLASVLAGGRSRQALLDLRGVSVRGFELTSILGVGGMGVTYVASDSREHVAVKVMEGLTDEARERFEAECHILQGLSHANIVRYRAHGFLDSGIAWLMMDLVAGLDLETVLEQVEGPADQRSAVASALAGETGAVPTESPSYRRRVLRILAKVADALHYAHEHGIVHRDIKPANILLRDDLEPVLIDFGLSRDLFRNVSLTRSAAVLGTLSYMAPEQLAGDARSVDRRTDVFALGLVLFRALVGRDLREETSAVLRSQRRRFLIPRDACDALPDEIQAVLYSCLEPKRTRRYDSAAELACDLRAIIGGDRPGARRPNKIQTHLRGPRGWLTKTACALAASGLAAVLLWPAPSWWLSIDATEDKGEGSVSIDGVRVGHTPLDGHPITPGEHTVEWKADGFGTVKTTVDVRKKFTRVNLLPIPKGLQPAESFYEGGDAAFLVIRPGSKDDKVLIDGTSIKPFSRWIRVSPGRHEISVRNQNTMEQQIVHLPASQFSSIHLLSCDELRNVPGKFRLTLGHVVSPMPNGLTLSLDDHSVVFMNHDQDTNPPHIPDPNTVPPDRLARHCFVTPAVPNTTATATLEVRFPERMKSIAFFYRAFLGEGDGMMRVTYHVEGGDERQLPFDDRAQYLFQAEVPPAGSRWFRLTARMRAIQRPVGFTRVHFLDAYMDQVPGMDRPCFAVVADP